MRRLSRCPLAFLLFVVWVSSGCQFFGQRSSLATHYNLPLTVQLRMDHSIAAASLDYRDACGQALTLPIRDGLETQLKKRMGQVFERVHLEPGPSTGAVDGVVDTARWICSFLVRPINPSLRRWRWGWSFRIPITTARSL